MNNKFYVTDELKKIRLERGLSREKLSAMIDISAKTIQRAENGKRIKLYCIERIAEAFDIDKNILIDTNK